RDLKPANVFIVGKKKKDGGIAGDDLVKVGDFGLAKIISQNQSGLTSGGRPPFTGDIMQIFAQKLTQETPALSTLRSEVPVPVEKAVMHALKKEADDRPGTVVEWFTEFNAAASGASAVEE